MVWVVRAGRVPVTQWMAVMVLVVQGSGGCRNAGAEWCQWCRVCQGRWVLRQGLSGR